MVPPGVGGRAGAAAVDGTQASCDSRLSWRFPRSASACGSGWVMAPGAARATGGCTPSWRWCWWPSAITTAAACCCAGFVAGVEPAQRPLVPLVQRAAGAAAAGHRDPGSRQAVLDAPVRTRWERASQPSPPKTAAWRSRWPRGADRLRQSLSVRRLARPGDRAVGLLDGAAGPSTGRASIWPPTWLGYAPSGFLLALAGAAHAPGACPAAVTVLRASLAAAAVAFAMETLQSYLPARIPSNVDLGLNTLGGLGWARAGRRGLERTGAVDRWGRFSGRAGLPRTRGAALVLLALWPLALLFPAAVHLRAGPGLRAARRRPWPMC